MTSHLIAISTTLSKVSGTYASLFHIISSKFMVCCPAQSSHMCILPNHSLYNYSDCNEEDEQTNVDLVMEI